MDASEAAQVLITGGGIAGTAVRRALALRRIPSLTLERRGVPEDGGLAINLPGNAVQALAQLGLAEALRSVGTPIRRREYRTERDRLLFAVDEAAFWGEAMADCLAGRSDWSGIGADYEARRRPRVAHVQAMTDRMSRSGRLPGWARRLLLPVIGPRSDRATYGPLREPVVP